MALGWDRLLAENWSPAVNSVLDVLQSAWVQYPAVFVLGLAIGLWADAFLRRREQRSDATPVAEIDHEALADEAEALSRKIWTLVGEAAGREQLAWYEDSQDMRMLAYQDTGRGPPVHERSTREGARTIERYAALYHHDAESIIARATKVINLDRGDLWNISHILSSHRGIGDMARLLTRIAVHLRHGQPDLPLSDRRRMEIEAQLAMNPQAQQISPQQPLDTEQKTQP